MKSHPSGAASAAFVSLGCFKNTVDTEVLGGFLEQRGICMVSAYEEADWLIINTCGFIRDAKEESIEEILSALEKKEAGEVKKVAVIGCLTERYFADMQRNFPGIDLFWGVNDLEGLAGQIAGAVPAPYSGKELFLYSHEHRRIHTTTPNSAFIKISEGCDMSCTFCAIPTIRGPFRSRPIDSIRREAEGYRSWGVSELNLISQNSTHFGMDREQHQLLPELLKEVSRIGFPWIRVLYLMPEEVTGEIIAAFSHPGVIPYFDLPFQHVVPAVLKRMGRSGNPEKALALIESIRRQFPEAVIRSSLIAGFPGETEADFSRLLEFVDASGIEYIGVFAYSDEEGTLAWTLPEKLSIEKIEERWSRLEERAELNLQSFRRRLKGSLQEFLPLGPWTARTTIGRIRSQAPEIDGLTEITGKFSGDYAPRPIRISGLVDDLLRGRPDKPVKKQSTRRKP